jgi:HAD superfamily hydrolase (TIGR01509 family)
VSPFVSPFSGLAFLFDLDGVLVHSTPLHNRAWEAYLEAHGIAAAGIEQRMFGKHNDEIVRDFFGGRITSEEIRHHGAEKERIYRSLIGEGIAAHLVPGVRAFLERARAVPKALASNAEPANVEFILEASGLRGYFQSIVDGDQAPRPKPAPDVYLIAAERLGVDPSNCVVFEDSPVGVAAARACGAACVIGVATTVPDLDGVDYRIRDFRDPHLDLRLAELTRR